jgi:inorganic pyrophosphatase
MGLRYKSHPWHGVAIGNEAPAKVTAFIEVVPTDTVKYEIDKDSGYLFLDRPQKYSNVIPALYGFIPQTFCGMEVGNYCMEKTGKTDIRGDGDPIDICVLTEKDITHGDILVHALPIGGFRMIDGNEADDKIIAVLDNDVVYEGYRDVDDLPSFVVERLKHYFLTYKDMPGKDKDTEITHTYGVEEAYEVIRRSMTDYQNRFENLGKLLY